MPLVLKNAVASSSLTSITYVPKDRLLEVVFRRTGHIYDYFGVPRETYEALMAADSKGAFLNQVIKPAFHHTRVNCSID